MFDVSVNLQQISTHAPIAVANLKIFLFLKSAALNALNVTIQWPGNEMIDIQNLIILEINERVVFRQSDSHQRRNYPNNVLEKLAYLYNSLQKCEEQTNLHSYNVRSAFIPFCTLQESLKEREYTSHKQF